MSKSFPTCTVVQVLLLFVAGAVLCAENRGVAMFGAGQCRSAIGIGVSVEGLGLRCLAGLRDVFACARTNDRSLVRNSRFGDLTHDLIFWRKSVSFDHHTCACLQNW